MRVYLTKEAELWHIYAVNRKVKMKHEITYSPVPFHCRVFPSLQFGHKITDVLSLQCLDLKVIIEIIFQRTERTELLTEYNNNSELILITPCSVLLY